MGKIAEAMSETDKKFEDLGYEKEYLKNRDETIWGIKYKNFNECVKITFDLVERCFCASSIEDEHCPMYLTMEELYVIVEKCKELGWIDNG